MRYIGPVPAQFEAVRESDERILWVGQPERVPFLIRGLPFLVIGLIWGAIDYFGFIRHMKAENLGFMIPFFALHLFPLWASILNMLRLGLVHGNTYYATTNKRLMMRTGFWGTDFKAIDYDQIVDMEVNVNPMENMYRAGTIRVSTGQTSRRGRRNSQAFVAIRRPYEVFKSIKKISVDIKTDWNYPNKIRPAKNPGYETEYTGTRS